MSPAGCNRLVGGVRTVVINLDRDQARLAAVSKEFARSSIAFERFAAVNGLAVPEAVRPYFFGADGRPAPTLTRGEVGCYASHLTLWRRIAQGRYGAPTLICEDDIGLAQDFVDVLDATLRSVDEGWDIIRLSVLSNRVVWPVCRIPEGYDLVRYSKVPVRLGAYLISEQGARKLLKPGLRTRPVDIDLARPWELDLNVYGIDPAPVFQPTTNPSSIDAIEQRRYPRRARGVLGIPSRLLGRDRLARYWYNARMVGAYRTVRAEIWNLFRDTPFIKSDARAVRDPKTISSRNEIVEF